MRRELGGTIGKVNIREQYYAAVLGAASQREAWAIMREATALPGNRMEALGASVDRLIAASNANTDEMSKRAKSTAHWTMALTFTTIALVIASIVQIVVMWVSLLRL